MEYQDQEAANIGSDQEGEGMEADGIGMEAGTTHQSLSQPSSPVSITTISDISDVLCAHNHPAGYCHNHQHYPVFFPPLEGKHIACNLLQHAQEAHEVSIGHITGSSIGNDNSDKENDPNAATIPPQSQGQGVGSHGRR